MTIDQWVCQSMNWSDVQLTHEQMGHCIKIIPCCHVVICVRWEVKCTPIQGEPIDARSLESIGKRKKTLTIFKGLTWKLAYQYATLRFFAGSSGTVSAASPRGAFCSVSCLDTTGHSAGAARERWTEKLSRRLTAPNTNEIFILTSIVC